MGMGVFFRQVLPILLVEKLIRDRFEHSILSSGDCKKIEVIDSLEIGYLTTTPFAYQSTQPASI